MSYSVNLLKTPAECDTLLIEANKEKSDLAFRKTSIERNQSNYAESSGEISTEFQVVNAEIAALTNTIDSLPDGNTKDDNVKKLKKLKYKKFLLEDRQDNYGVIALLSKEHDLAIVNAELAEKDVFIAALEARKAGL